MVYSVCCCRSVLRTFVGTCSDEVGGFILRALAVSSNGCVDVYLEVMLWIVSLAPIKWSCSQVVSRSRHAPEAHPG